MSNTLAPGQSLKPGDRITSASGSYYLTLQDDGNLVEYINASGIEPKWSTETKGKNVTEAVMQPDGNFVLYGPDLKVVWSTKTDKHDGSSLLLQDDGNLVIYYPNPEAIWSNRK
jgi:hypothetical protein